MIEHKGLSSAEVLASREKHGKNQLEAPPRKSLWLLFAAKFKDPLIIILCAGAVLSLLTGGMIESSGILLAVLLSAGIGFFSEYRSGRAFDLLNRADDELEFKTFRDGKLTGVRRCDLVVGDILYVETGEEIPADGEVLDSMNLHVDESKFTGEPEPILKLPRNHQAYAEKSGDAAYPPETVLRGASVLEGNAHIRVTEVGMSTVIGRTTRSATEITDTVTPLQKQLARLSKVIAIFGVTLSTLLAATLLLQSHQAGTLGELQNILSILMVAITLIVVTVPEGLPMSVTLSLACSMRRMAQNNVLIRKLHAAETIGSATVICTDKTGTLTMNRMRLASSHFTTSDRALADEAMAINSTAELDGDRVLGNPTEGALLFDLRNREVDYGLLRRDLGVSHQWPFNTLNKFMATRTAGGMLHLKGAPEIILEKTTLLADGETIRPLTDMDRKQLQKAFHAEQNLGRRTLGFACEDQAAAPDQAKSLIFLGFVAIADPVRPEVPDAIAACAEAGIRVKIVTGDTANTAAEIGRQIHLKEFPVILEGRSFAELDAEATDQAAAELDIIARARPEDKLKLVRTLQRHGEVVAVTGDGTNDAPALHHADVGISMGVTGTSVAREASDVILLDDSFQSIVNAVLWGRSLYLNIQRFLVFQLTINVSAAMIALLGPFLGVALPFTVIQMLWVNLIMDTFAALALATEPPTPQVMTKPPRDPKAFIVTREMAGWIFGTALVFVVLFVIMMSLYRAETLTTRQLTIMFTSFVLLQFWNLLNVRMLGSGKSMLRDTPHNPWFIWIALLILGGQILITQYGGRMFRTEPLTFTDWLILIGATSPIFFIGEAIRLTTAGFYSQNGGKKGDTP